MELKYKDSNNTVHQIEEGYEHLLPSGGVKITDAEAAVLLTPPPPTAQEITAQVKAEAQRRILAILPQWKQANLTARGVELSTKMLMGGTLTQAEKDEMEAGFALWDKVKAIRAASDLIEQNPLLEWPA